MGSNSNKDRNIRREAKFLTNHNLTSLVGNEEEFEWRDLRRRHWRRVRGRRKRRVSVDALIGICLMLVTMYHAYHLMNDDGSYDRPMLNRTRPAVQVNCDRLNVTNVLDSKRVRVPESTPRRVIDAFVFNDEFDMLRVHLDEMYDVVDMFVIAESTRTFQGDTKPLHLTNSNLSWLENDPVLRSKIRIVVVDDMPTCNKTSAWACEFHQRNALARGFLSDVRDDDVVIISDVDEILRRDVATSLKFCNVPLPAVAQTSFYYYSAHWKKRFLWNHPNIVSGQDVRRGMSIQQLRQGVKREANGQWVVRSKSILENAGWHFSYFMKVNEIVRKIQSFSHTEYRSVAENPLQILSSVCTGTDLFSRDPDKENLDYIKDITDMPSCILESPSAWSRFTSYDPIHDPACASSNSLSWMSFSSYLV